MSKYIFDPNALQEAANCGAGLPMSERWDVIHKELALVYASPSEWEGWDKITSRPL
jgi:hypothetical protein